MGRVGLLQKVQKFTIHSKNFSKKNKSILPKTLIDIKKLPGIGDYTGNVLLALIYNQPKLALDGNVKRIFSRIFNMPEKKLTCAEDVANFAKFIMTDDADPLYGSIIPVTRGDRITY